VQSSLRQAFGCWGLPAEMGLDNGLPWGDRYELPSALALWLVGLGVVLKFLPVGQKQLNGVIERAQGTGQRWCEPQTCASAAQLQERLEEMDLIQRQDYPSFPEGSRLDVFPELLQVVRPYSRAWEEENWDLRRAQQYLSGHAVVRRANKQGQVSVYDHCYSIGARNRGQRVLIYYDPGTNEWVCTLEQTGQQLRRYKAWEITRERIMAQKVSD
jgi:hypothetical protein